MIYATHMIYALRMKTDGYYIILDKGKYIIQRLLYIISPSRYIIVIILLEKYMMSENKLLDLSFELAVYIVDLIDSVKVPKSAYMLDQLARAGTSVGANIYEAQYAQSKKDFVSKMEIALKESNEATYWLKLMRETNRIDEQTYSKAEKLCGNIRRLLIATCKTAKDNQQ